MAIGTDGQPTQQVTLEVGCGRRPWSPPVMDTTDLDDLTPHAVDDDIATGRNDQLTCPQVPAFASHQGIVGQTVHVVADALQEVIRRLDVVLCDIVRVLVESSPGAARLSDVHQPARCS